MTTPEMSEEAKARELADCPFCGERPKMFPLDPKTEGDAWTKIACTSERCVVQPETSAYSDDKAARETEVTAAWNTRAQPSPLAGDEIVEAALEQTCQHFGYSTKRPPGAVIGFARKAIEIALTSLNRREDWAQLAALFTLDVADYPPRKRSDDGKGAEHAAWMLDEIVQGRISGRKAHRWLGYAQGVLVVDDFLTLEEAKAANKRASDGDPNLPQALESNSHDD